MLARCYTTAAGLGGALAAGAFKLATLGADAGLGLAVLGAGDTKVLDSLAGRLLASQQESLLPLGRTEGQLVEGEGLTAGGKDAGAGGLGKLEGGDGHLGDDGHALVISDGGDDDDDGGILAGGHVLADDREGEGRAVRLAHAQTLQDNLVKVGAGAAGEEAIQLHQQVEIDVVAGGRSAHALLDVVAVNIDTLPEEKRQVSWNLRMDGWMDEYGGEGYLPSIVLGPSLPWSDSIGQC